MKKVIRNKELKEVLKAAVDLICDTASSTLGPSGNNVIINTSDYSPFITNDGVTIASSIESENKGINTVLELIKEASLKTNELVGDGTTTTLVLLKEIFNEGLKKIENGKNSIELKKELTISLNNILDKLERKKRKPLKRDYEKVAITSSNSLEIGKFLSDIFYKMKSKYSIKLEEGNSEKTYYEIKKGYNLETDDNSLLLNNKEEIILENSLVLLIRGYLKTLEDISEIINESIIRNKNLIILVSELEENLRREIMLFNLKENKNIFIFKVPDFGSRKDDILTDLSIISSSKIKNIDYENIYFNDLGLSNVIINKSEIIFLNDNSNIKNYVKKLKIELFNCNNDYKKDFISLRLSKFQKGIVTIYVGGKTKTEIKEKLMRFEDALCSVEEAKKGILIGGGISLFEISNSFVINNSGDEILKKALKMPLKKIIENGGKNYDFISNKIIEYDYKKIYNLKKEKYENVNESSVIDSFSVISVALKNAISIASLLLTTNYLVINENIINDKNFI